MAKKKKRLGEPVSCMDCKSSFLRTSMSQKRCPACAKEAKRASVREWCRTHRAKEGYASGSAIGTLIQCAVCGAEIEKRSARQKYCAECSIEANRARTREKDRERDAKKRRREYEAAGAWPAKTEGKSLAQVNAEARALGLTYGKYQALILSGGLEAFERGR